MSKMTEAFGWTPPGIGTSGGPNCALSMYPKGNLAVPHATDQGFSTTKRKCIRKIVIVAVKPMSSL